MFERSKACIGRCLWKPNAIQGEISIGARYFDMKEDMRRDAAADQEAREDSVDGKGSPHMTIMTDSDANAKWLYFGGCHLLFSWRIFVFIFILYSSYFRRRCLAFVSKCVTLHFTPFLVSSSPKSLNVCRVNKH